MFGYILPDKLDLRMRDYEEYHAVYCGLCDTLRRFGFGAKMLLHYDFVFSAMLHLSLGDAPPEFYDGRCNTNPLQKEKLLKRSDQLDYSAAALLLSARYKLADDRRDETLTRRIAAAGALAVTSGAYKKARAAQPEMDASIAACMADQVLVENARCDSVDRACDATAQALGYIFEQMSDTTDTRRVLWRLGYLVGRFVYLADAADDLKDDLRLGRYNVFAVQNALKPGDDTARFIEEARGHMRLTAAEIEQSYRLLHPKWFVPVLDNIIYRGLSAAVDRVGADKKGKQDD